MAALYTETVVYFATWSGTDPATPISTETLKYLLTGKPTTFLSTSTVTHVESSGSSENTLIQVIAVPVTVQSGGGAYTATDASSTTVPVSVTSSTLDPSTSTYTRTYTQTSSDASGALETTTITSTSTGTFSPSTVTNTYTTSDADAEVAAPSTITTTSIGIPTLGSFTSTYTTTTSDAAGLVGSSTVTTTSYGPLPLASASTTAAPAATAPHSHKHHIAGGTIAAIVVGAVAGIALTVFLTWLFLRRRAKNQVYEIQPSISSAQTPRSPGREAGFGLTPPSLHEKDTNTGQDMSVAPPSRAGTVASGANGNPTRHVSVIGPPDPPARGSVLNPTHPLPFQAHIPNVELEGDIPSDVSMRSRLTKARRYFQRTLSGEAVPTASRDQGMMGPKSQKARDVLGL